jgi:hypothetical protein
MRDVKVLRADGGGRDRTIKEGLDGTSAVEVAKLLQSFFV